MSTDAENDREERAQALMVDFVSCVETGRGRVDNKDRWYGLYTFIRRQGPEAGIFADELQKEFDESFQRKIVQTPEDCLELSPFKGKFTVEDFPPER